MAWHGQRKPTYKLHQASVLFVCLTLAPPAASTATTPKGGENSKGFSGWGRKEGRRNGRRRVGKRGEEREEGYERGGKHSEQGGGLPLGGTGLGREGRKGKVWKNERAQMVLCSTLRQTFQILKIIRLPLAQSIVGLIAQSLETKMHSILLNGERSTILPTDVFYFSLLSYDPRHR